MSEYDELLAAVREIRAFAANGRICGCRTGPKTADTLKTIV